MKTTLKICEFFFNNLLLFETYALNNIISHAVLILEENKKKIKESNRE
jgi:hypothetical protein